MWVRVVAILALFACGTKHPSKSSSATCAQVADHVESLFDPKRDPKREHSHDIREVFATRCDKDKWSSEVRACVLGTTSLKDPRHCKTKLTSEQRGALESGLAAADEKQRGRLPPDCVEYETLIKRLGSCDKLPRASRDALKTAFDQSKTGWSKVTPDGKAALGTACKAAADAVKQSAASVCGW
jgi:hypothetical protein